MIEVKGIDKKFWKNGENHKRILFYADKDVSFEVKEGEILGILGPNGAGKTTLLRILSGIMKPSSGNLVIDGMTYEDNELEIKKMMSNLSGNTKLYKDISPRELLLLCGEYYGVDKSILNERIDEIVDKFEMRDFVNQRIENLSTGQYQRVNIARCLIHDPKYYIFDEATSGLDVISGRVIIDFIKSEKRRGKCIIYSTHYMEEADSICDRIIMMNKGQIIAMGKPKEIKKETKTDNLRDAFLKKLSEVDKER